MKVTVPFSREIPDGEGGYRELNYDLTCDVSPLIPAVTTGPIEHSHPAEGGEVELVEAECDGKKVQLELTAEEWAIIDERAIEAAGEDDGGPEWDDDDRFDRFSGDD
jgi:hypothetical protein